MVGPAGGVNAVAMTLATHPEPAAALRASLTWTSPKGALMVQPLTLFARVPRLPAVVGALMAKTPPVIVTVAVVAADAADAGTAIARVMSVAAAIAPRYLLGMSVPLSDGC
jgi:hypothetical protein